MTPFLFVLLRFISKGGVEFGSFYIKVLKLMLQNW
jgi:hypothetical protein